MDIVIRPTTSWHFQCIFQLLNYLSNLSSVFFNHGERTDNVKTGLSGNAPRDQGVHHRLCDHHPGRADGDCIPLPVILQPPPHFKAISSVETGHNFSVFWHFWVQLLVQHDLHLPVLQDAGGGQLQRQICRLCYDVCFWSIFYDNLCIFCEPSLLGSGIYHHACLCVGQEEPLHPDELLWSAHIQCSLPPLGLAWLLTALGKFCVGWSSWNGCWTLLLFSGGYFPKPARRMEIVENSTVFENDLWPCTRRPNL